MSVSWASTREPVPQMQRNGSDTNLPSTSDQDDLDEGLAQLRSVFSATCGLVMTACSSMSLLSPAGLASDFLGRGGGDQQLGPIDLLHGCKRSVRKRALAALPHWYATEADVGSECHICMELAEPRETLLMQLPCGHTFCAPCITQWLAQNHTCPTCRWEFDQGETRVKRPSSHSGPR